MEEWLAILAKKAKWISLWGCSKTREGRELLCSLQPLLFIYIPNDFSQFVSYQVLWTKAEGSRSPTVRRYQ